MAGTGQRGLPAGLPQVRPVARTPAPCVRAPRRQMAPYHGMQVSCGGQGDGVGTPRVRESAWAPTEPPGKSRALAPVAPGASPASCHGACSHSRKPRFAAGECLLRTPKTGVHRCLHGEWGSSTGGLRLQSVTGPSPVL